MDARRKLALAIGAICAIFSSLLLVLALFLAFNGADTRQPIGFAVISVFPLLIAIACLIPKHRTTALRLVGGVTAAAMIGVIINSTLNADTEIGGKGLVLYFAMLAGSVAMALKGRWPS